MILRRNFETRRHALLLPGMRNIVSVSETVVFEAEQQKDYKGMRRNKYYLRGNVLQIFVVMC
jgi:hypothetical protein